MKFIHVADLHVHPFREFSANNGMDRLQDGLNAVEQACALAEQHQCVLVIGGDLKNHKDKWYDAVLNGYMDIFSRYLNHTIILAGNHDGVKGQSSGLEVFRHVQNMALVTKPILSKDLLGEMALFYPWSPTWSDLDSYVQQAKQAKAKIIFSHAFLEGAKIGSGDYQLKRGLPLAAFGLDIKDRVFDWGFFGDIHKQQRVREFRANRKSKLVVEGEVWYAGSPYAQRKDETEQDKGALLVDLNAPKVVTPLVISAPRFQRIDLSEDTTLNVNTKLALWITKAKKQTTPEWRNDFVEITVPHKTDITLLEQLRAVVKPRMFYAHIKPPQKGASVKRAELHAGMSSKELVRAYLKTKTTPEGVTVETLEKAGLMLMDNLQ